MSIVRRWTPALLTLALVGPASAQAPLVTAAGDPSVDDDSIYALVVDPADYPEDAAIRLLDDGIVRIADDGTYLETYRTVVQVLRQEAVDGWSTFTYTIRPDVERYRLNWVRVLRADGTLISDQPLHYQENDVGGGDGMYVDQTQIDFELAGVGVGAIIDYSYTVETYAPILEGDLYLSWGITTGTPVRRSRYILEAPQATRLRIEERNPPAPATVTVHDGAVTRTWAYADLETIEPELFAADSANPYSSLAISGDVSWAEIGAWFAGLARGRTTVDHSLAAVLDSVTRGHAGADAIEALHRWVAQDIRYVSLSLGIGGYQPRLPAEVVRTLAGDCKDKAMLFVVGARRLGYEAYPVLVSSGGWADRDHPSIGQFDHAIAAFRRGEEPWRYVDLTADLVPHGEIPGGLQGSFGLLVRDDGAVEEVELPNTQVFENTKYSEMAGELLPDGSFRGRYRERAEGFPGFAMRGWIPLPLGASEKREAAQVVARSLFPAATGDSLIAYVGRDWNQPTDLQLHSGCPSWCRISAVAATC